MLSLGRKVGQGVWFTNLKTGETDYFTIIDIGENRVTISTDQHVPYGVLYTRLNMDTDINICFIRRTSNTVSVNIDAERIINIRRSELAPSSCEISAIRGKQV